LGTWGHDSFEDDDALDWVFELEKSTDTSVVFKALNAVTDGAEDLLEAPVCAMAIAAAEVVAALDGHRAPSLPEQVVEWIKGKPKPGTDLKAKALRAIDAILTDSELKSCWEDAGEHYPKWVAAVERLKARL